MKIRSDGKVGCLIRLLLAGALVFAVSGVTPAAASTFTNSIYGYADPFLTYTNGLYYLTGTDSGYIKIIAAPSLGGLNSARVVSVYNVGAFFESPEFYWFGSPYNHWYIYYTQYPNSIVVIESDTASLLGTYHFKSTLTTNTYDATVVNIHGGLYLLGSTYRNLVIQSLSNPYTVSSAQVPIAGLTQSWESNVIEAPEAIVNPQGVLYLLYSSGTYNNANYAEGALKYGGGNPLVAANWTKLPGPLFRGTDTNGNFATATCSPFKSPNGLQDWFVYGGYPTSAFTSRSTRAQQMTWNSDGSPNLGSPIPLGQLITEPAAAVTNTPPVLSAAVAGGGSVLSISWPTNYSSYILQGQTGSLSVGLSTNWTTINTTNNQINLPVNHANGSVFLRLINPQ